MLFIFVINNLNYYELIPSTLNLKNALFRTFIKQIDNKLLRTYLY